MNQHPENQPVVPCDETSERSQAKNSSQPKSRTPEEIAFTAQELEKNISRLSQNAHAPSNPSFAGSQPSQNFDAVDYASLSRSAARRTKRKPSNSEPIRNTPDVDPYIDPSELAKPDVGTKPDPRTDQITSTRQDHSRASEHPRELVSGPHEPLRENMQPNASLETATTDGVAQRSLEEQTNMPTQETLPTSPWFSDPLSIITPRTSVPMESQTVVSDLKFEPSEPCYDIREFSDCASGKIELIRGAYQADSEAPTVPSSPSYPSSFEHAEPEPHTNIESKADEDIFDKDEVFLARTGDVIEVNGEDGFDRIDLACFDINCATISSNTIRIDDEQTGSFEIHFKGVDYAIFANGVKIRLDTGSDSGSNRLA